jgi:integrase
MEKPLRIAECATARKDQWHSFSDSMALEDKATVSLAVAETCFLGHFGTPKSRASRREVPLSHSALGALKAHYSRSTHRESHALVFATRNGGPLMSNNLRRGLRSACVRAGLPRLNWHALRHTHGTLLHGQGTPPKVAQAQFGHSHLTTTLEVYTHASVTAPREAVNLLDKTSVPSCSQ